MEWRSWLFVLYKGPNRFWRQHNGTGGDPSAWGDRKASILNVTPPSNVCWHRRFRRTCCLIWQYVAPDCRRWIYLRRENPKALIFVGIRPRIGMRISRRFGNHRFKSEWIWGEGRFIEKNRSKNKCLMVQTWSKETRLNLTVLTILDCQVAESLCHVKVSGFDSQLEQDKLFLCDVKVSVFASESEQDKSLLCDAKDKKRDNSDTV